MSVYNDFQRDGEQQELRCQSCNKWLDKRDLSCGLSLYCVDCCTEPDFMHTEAEEDHER